MLKITTGTEDFKDLIENYYFVDKSQFIEDVFSDKVMFYTRPRRFGKTLNMSMLEYFFSISHKKNAYLFDHLKINQNKDIMKHQNQYPVIFITLKDMKGLTFEDSIHSFASIIKKYLITNFDLVNSIQEKDLKAILTSLKANTASMEDLKNALYYICQSLHMHHNKKVIVLLEEL